MNRGLQGPGYLRSLAQERAQRLAGLTVPDPRALLLWQKALTCGMAESDRADLGEAFRYAEAIDYSHDGLPSAIYFAHPVRVASFAILSSSAPAREVGTVGLLHNVMDVSAVTHDELSSIVGENIADQVECLVVDRSRQWDADYKASYYRTLQRGPKAARVVKVFDKLDNMFLIDQNPDIATRRRYMVEIEQYIVPMARDDVPEVLDYLNGLLRWYYEGFE